jgi:DNA-binding GntR family transcriptional regulator
MNKEIFKRAVEENPFETINKIVYDLMYDAIIKLDFLPGEKINVAQIANDLEISRTPILEAIKQLKQNGVVLSYENKSGYYVSYLDIADFQSVHFSRRMLESHAVYLYTKYNPTVRFDELKEAAEEFYKAFTVGNYRRIADLDNFFHNLIVEECDNDYIKSMYKGIEKKMSRYIQFSTAILGKTPSALSARASQSQHLAICNAIEMKLPDLAKRAMEEHMDTVSQGLFLHVKDFMYIKDNEIEH